MPRATTSRAPTTRRADGVLALSEIASLLGKPLLPVLPPWGTVFAAAQLRRLGLADSVRDCSASCAPDAGSTTVG